MPRLTLTALSAALAIGSLSAAEPPRRATAADAGVERPAFAGRDPRLGLCASVARPDPVAVVSAHEPGGVNAWPGSMVVTFGVRNDSPCRYHNAANQQRVIVSFSGCRAAARLVRPVPDGVVPIADADLVMTFNTLEPGETQTRTITLLYADATPACAAHAEIRHDSRAVFHDSRPENDDADFGNNRASSPLE